MQPNKSFGQLALAFALAFGSLHRKVLDHRRRLGTFPLALAGIGSIMRSL